MRAPSLPCTRQYVVGVTALMAALTLATIVTLFLGT
jgi:hypothetical protein